MKNPLLAKVGVDVKGSIVSPKISLGKVRYADLYKPEKQGAAEKRATLEIKRRESRRSIEGQRKMRVMFS